MAQEPPRVFLVTLEGLEPPAEDALTVLAFARAPEADAAQAIAGGALRDLGWREVRALRTGELVDWAALPEDFRDAVATAVRQGCSLIIYENP